MTMLNNNQINQNKVKYHYLNLASRLLNIPLEYPTHTHKFKWLFCTEKFGTAK